jgi:crossover junction endodeoxyribonuclease RusA
MTDFRTFSYTLDGPPVPKARPRFSHGRAFTPPKTRAFEAKVGRAAQIALGGMLWPLDERYRIDCHFFYPDARRRDSSNCLKSVEDGMNGIAWNDDCQIIEGHFYGAIDRTNPRTIVRVTILPKDET